ncbi:hypothetical protein Trco_005597 [Trichoderma cornu-damae]|uniref:Uncharacterized protein n=1 Tax=Trichoderma cornu-damae TaxID=654480 RepID=A0A9P8TWM4_9HYPO|nr:hypothetical protein Trco_005597 [Trichoderma cornu-damae]
MSLRDRDKHGKMVLRGSSTSGTRSWWTWERSASSRKIKLEVLISSMSDLNCRRFASGRAMNRPSSRSQTLSDLSASKQHPFKRWASSKAPASSIGKQSSMVYDDEN